MARPVYQHELLDPDFAWLMMTFKENHPEYVWSENSAVPVTFFKVTNEEFHKMMLPVEMLNSENSGDSSSSEKKSS